MVAVWSSVKGNTLFVFYHQLSLRCGTEALGQIFDVEIYMQLITSTKKNISSHIGFITG